MVRKVKEVGPPRKFKSGAATEMSCETPGGSNVHVAEASMAFCTLMLLEVVTLGRALCSPVRVQILQTIGERRMSVKDVATSLGICHALASYHLGCLFNARVVSYKRVGRRRLYRRTDDGFACLIGAVPTTTPQR